MGFLMNLKIGFSSKSFLTDFTLKQLLATVGSLVSSQMTVICKPVSTLVTLVWLHPTVDFFGIGL